MPVAVSPVSVTLQGSLRLRLLLGTLVWITASILLSGWALSGLFRQHVAQQFHAQLRIHLDQLVAHLQVDQEGKLSLSVSQSDPRFSKPLSGLYWQVDDPGAKNSQAHGALRSRSLWDEVLILPADALADGAIHQHRIQGPGNTSLGVVERSILLDEATESAARKFRLLVAADMQQMEEPVEHFNGILWLALGLLGAGLALVAVVQVLIALAPLRRLHGALAAVRSGETSRLEGHFPQEVQPLVEEFNSVLAQNSEVVGRARTQAGNLAHALKTPLSVIANAVADSQAEASLAQVVSSQVEVARQQIDYHLSRARVAAPVNLPGVRTLVTPVLEGLLRVMQRVYAERNLEIRVLPNQIPVVFQGEAQDLQEMLGNLLDNACKWAVQRVQISQEVSGNELVISIDDDGCGIAPAEHQRVLSRGQRLDEQVPGSGLGLAIVDDLARLYGGRVELADSPLGGLRVVLSLPSRRMPAI